MKICMVISTPFPPEEGIGYHVYNIARRLIRRGHTVTVLTRGTFVEEHDTYDGIEVVRVPFVPIYPFHVALHKHYLQNYIRKHECEFDILHIHSPLAPYIETNLPTVSTIHTSVVEDAKHIENVDAKSLMTKCLTKYVSYPCISSLLEQSDVVTTVSESVIGELKQHYNYNNAVITGNGVDEVTFRPKEVTDDQTIGDQEFILYVGRLSYRKGLFDLLESAKAVSGISDAKFIIIGKGELEFKLKKIICNKTYSGRVQLLGHVNRTDLISYYQNSAVFVMPSHYESGPLTLLEAMSCGRPVISTSVGIAPELITTNENGIVVPPGSVEDITKSIAFLLENKSFREKLGRNARNTIENNSTWDSITCRVEACYQRATE